MQIILAFSAIFCFGQIVYQIIASITICVHTLYIGLGCRPTCFKALFTSRSCKTKYIRVQYVALWVRPGLIGMWACITSVLSKEAFYTADMIIILYAKMLLFCGSGGGQKVSTMSSYVTFTSSANLCVLYSPYMVYSFTEFAFHQI